MGSCIVYLIKYIVPVHYTMRASVLCYDQILVLERVQGTRSHFNHEHRDLI